jgi:hypothetical protein
MADDLALAEGLVRIRVPLEGAGGTPQEDAIWAEPLGSDRYRIESCPFLAYGISRDDVVRAAVPGQGGEPVLEHVVEKGGHRTLRVALDPDVSLEEGDVAALLARLVDFGCTWESARPKLVALDLPPEVEVARVVAHLEAARRDGALLWEWVDPRPC